MSQACAISSCKRSSCALCHCCQQNICLPHLKEHQDLLVSELNPLVDQINSLRARLKALNLENTTGDVRRKMEQWRVECHQKIDHFFKEKCRELDLHVTGKVDKQGEEISRIQSKVAEIIREQHTTRHDLDLLISRIRDLEREINKIEQTPLNIRSQSLKIDGSWITIEELREDRLDLPNLPPVYKAIERFPASSPAMASNDHFLLIHQKTNLYLVDRHFKVLKHVLWSDGYIRDMCWSSVLHRFIIITPDSVFLVDQNTTLPEKVTTIQSEEFYSCTCSDKSLFLSRNNLVSSVFECSPLTSTQLIQHGKPRHICPKGEIINHIRYNNGTLALLITKSTTEIVQIELRASNTFQRLWSLQLNIQSVHSTAFCCCPINDNEWLVTDHENSRLIHITGDGNMKAMCPYDSVPVYSCMFGSDILAVTTRKSISFHQL